MKLKHLFLLLAALILLSGLSIFLSYGAVSSPAWRVNNAALAESIKTNATYYASNDPDSFVVTKAAVIEIGVTVGLCLTLLLTLHAMARYLPERKMPQRALDQRTFSLNRRGWIMLSVCMTAVACVSVYHQLANGPKIHTDTDMDGKPWHLASTSTNSAAWWGYNDFWKKQHSAGAASRASNQASKEYFLLYRRPNIAYSLTPIVNWAFLVTPLFFVLGTMAVRTSRELKKPKQDVGDIFSRLCACGIWFCASVSAIYLYLNFVAGGQFSRMTLLAALVVVLLALVLALGMFAYFSIDYDTRKRPDGAPAGKILGTVLKENFVFLLVVEIIPLLMSVAKSLVAS